MELSVWASERGVWIAKWPAVAIVADDVRMSLLQSGFSWAVRGGWCVVIECYCLRRGGNGVSSMWLKCRVLDRVRKRLMRQC